MMQHPRKGGSWSNEGPNQRDWNGDGLIRAQKTKLGGYLTLPSKMHYKCSSVLCAKLLDYDCATIA
jgi:hypothetical protein